MNTTGLHFSKLRRKNCLISSDGMNGWIATSTTCQDVTEIWTALHTAESVKISHIYIFIRFHHLANLIEPPIPR